MNAPVTVLDNSVGNEPVVVIGAGPAGARAVQELLRWRPDAAVVWYGDETWLPYNRIKLSSLLAGEVSWESLIEGSGRVAHLPPNVECRFGVRVAAIDREARTLSDSTGAVQAYSAVLLATGSAPHVPAIPGIELSGVFTFRDLADAQRLQARIVRSRVTVVIGGGLLGLEAARAVRRFNTEVWVIEQEDRLMPRQLDVGAAEVLSDELRTLGLKIRVSDGVRAIFGNDRVAGVRLRDGSEIACDTVIVATGIRPRVELAVAAGLPVGSGVRVDDRLRTADPHIFAVGECAEHRGRVYGLVSPGLEQAAVAAGVIGGVSAMYEGSVSATNLKVMGCKVFSIGEVDPVSTASLTQSVVYRENGVYRRLSLRQGRLVGAIGVGEWPERSRVQEAVRSARLVWPWQRRRFALEGRLWADDAGDDVALWPASATICNCTGVTKGQLEGACRSGCTSVEALTGETGAGSVCGSCKPLLSQLLGGAALPAVRAAKALAVFTLLALLGALFYALAGIPFPDSVDPDFRWDLIWRDKDIKEISGYTVLGVMAVLAVITLRKRVDRVRVGSFDIWRLLHVAIGVLLIGGLLFHTGGRLGYRLDLVLSLSVVAALISGVVIAAVLARQHALKPGLVRRAQRMATLAHIFSLWVMPALLGFHIFKFYYF